MILREQLLQQALTLPAADQAFLAQSLEDHLITNVPPQTAESEGIADAEFLSELKRRSATHHSGQTSSRLAADALGDLRKRQSDEKYLALS
ncbi:MAG: hypothetical protein WD045_04730 [Pirellulaceae bacterium]